MIHNHLNSQYLSSEGFVHVLLAYIQHDAEWLCDFALGKAKRRRVSRTTYNVNRVADLWHTPWGVMLQDEGLRDNQSRASKKFRLRFRVSYPLFLYIVQRCEEVQLFGITKIPSEFRVLVSLRILARGNCADDIFEMSGIAESTVNYMFHQFTQAFVKAFYDEFVHFPSTDAELDEVATSYEQLGFPGACGSMDVTHVRLGKCPHGLKVLATGKEGFPTLAFQAICAPNRKILYCSTPYLGSYNDITITANDVFCQRIQEDILDGVRYKIVGEDGIPRWTTGGYLIVDGGYQPVSWLMNPFSSGCSADEKRWSEWLESVRKDIECTFGILKARFRLFDMPLRFHRFSDIEYAWKSACILHNMNITYNGNDLADWERNINWSYLDPDFDTLEGNQVLGDDIALMNDYYEEEASSHRYRRPLGHQQRIVTDNTESGSEFHGRNTYHYYDKRQQLVGHFNVMFKLGLVKWPRRSGVATRLLMRIPKVDMRNMERTRHALYARNSDLSRAVLPGYDPTVGEGLFSHYAYHKGDVIAQFQGVVMTRDEYDTDVMENATGGYSITLTRQRVLQSYHARFNGDCIASLANSATHCLNTSTGLPAINNCKITRNNNDVIKLICDRQYIAPHTELCWDYGGDYQFPPPVPV